MEQLGQSLLSAGLPAGLSTLIVAVMIGVDRYLRYRSDTAGTKTTGENRERELLSADQQAFRAAILEQLSVMQKQVLELQDELNTAREDHIDCERRYIILEAQLKSGRKPCSPASPDTADDLT